MKISVVVPTRNNYPHLEKCIKSLKNQAKKPAEIIIVSPKGDSSQKTAEKFGCRWVDDRKNTIGNAYNAGASASKSEIIAFTDDDCVLPKKWLAEIEKGISDTDVVAGDDIIDEKNSSYFQNAAFTIDKARAQNSKLHGRDAAARARACNIAFRKKIFRKMNFDTELRGLQEPEFLYRLQKDGYRIKFDPKILVYHTRRGDLRGIFRQIYRNGKAKTELVRRHRGLISPYDILIAAGFVLTLIALATGPIFLKAWLSLVAAYFLLKPAYILARARSLKHYPALLCIVFVREVAYALGLVAGTLRL